MMVLPLVVIVLLPKVVNTNDPEMRRVSEHKFHVFSMLSIDHMYIYFCFVFLFFDRRANPMPRHVISA